MVFGKCAYMLLLIVTLLVGAASAQTNISAVVGQGTADRALDAKGSGFEIQAGADATTATIKASQVISSRFFNELQFSASAPLSKGSDTTTLAAASGFPNSFTVTGKALGFRFAEKDPDDNETDRICKEMRAAAMARGLTQEEADGLDCESGNVGEYVPQLLREFLALFFDTTKGHYMWGGSATVGHRVFEYLQTSDQEKVSATRTPWGVSAFVGVIPPETAMLIAAGFEYRDKYKDADSATICPPAGSTAVQCKTGPLDGPKKEQQKLVFVELRRLIFNRAVSLKMAYDFETNKPSADLPVYLVRTASGALSGGIRAGWEKDKELQFGVFVSGTFSLFPF